MFQNRAHLKFVAPKYPLVPTLVIRAVLLGALIGTVILITMNNRYFQVGMNEVDQLADIHLNIVKNWDTIASAAKLGSTIGHVAFENRYIEAEAQIHENLKTLGSLSKEAHTPLKAELATVTKIVADLQNQISKLDYQAFDLTRTNGGEAARKILFGVNYEKLQNEMLTAQNRLEKVVNSYQRHTMKDIATRYNRQMVLLVLALFAEVVSTVIILLLNKKWGLKVQQINKSLEDVVQQRTKDLVDAQAIAKIGSWSLEPDTRGLSWSSELYSIFEIANPQPKDSLFQQYRSRIHPEDVLLLEQLLENAAKNSEDFTFEHRICFGDDQIKYVRTIGKVVKSVNGRPSLINGTCQDITEEVKNKNALDLEKNKSLRSSKLASLGEMSAGIAHEINNPLAIIAGASNALPKFLNDPEKIKEKLVTIDRAVRRIAKIVKSLQKFARSSERQSYKQYSLNNIIKEALILTESKSKRHSTPVTVDCRTEGQILCDEIEIEQILINLINNGIDAVGALTEKWVRITLFEQNNYVILQVRDSGSGLPREVKKNLFQPFFTTKQVGKGTGLGLSIVKGILDEHQASIDILENDANTCFEIRFNKAEVVQNAA
ncbi:MAG TPA: ATP-binding protein [Oligoflexia bacterium]|nr:ATP-binding protein [Oligoflexia bacterium]